MFFFPQEPEPMSCLSICASAKISLLVCSRSSGGHHFLMFSPSTNGGCDLRGSGVDTFK